MAIIGGYHATAEGVVDNWVPTWFSKQYNNQYKYDFQTFFHPLVGELIKKLNQTSVAGMLAPKSLHDLGYYILHEYPLATQDNPGSNLVQVDIGLADIDTQVGGPYANYNWELVYHVPVMIAVHLSNNQRFAEAQKWFHYVFDPTVPDQKFWKCLPFYEDGNNPPENIEHLLKLLSNPDNSSDSQHVLTGYDAILQDPFHPHVVARTRPSAYQWYVIMKYLDNLIAWGDSLFLQDTIETLNEASLCYMTAAKILGPRPQALPSRGAGAAKTFKQLKEAGLDPMGNAMIDLESQFPLNLARGPRKGNGADDLSGALFGIARTQYFCIPPNKTLLAYWDTIADRLFKIRNSENIEGVVQQLPLFDPPLDPGMLVKAAAAGIDIGSIVSGLNQPPSPVRSPLLIQKALELAAEVRSLGNALLASIEKYDAERLALLRQGHELQLQKMVQDVRLLQWQHARKTTEGLLRARAIPLERYNYYLRLLGHSLAQDTVPATVPPDVGWLAPDGGPPLTEAIFNDAYGALVSKYDQQITPPDYPQLQLAQGSSPSNQSGASGQGQLYLNAKEDAELNSLLPTARDLNMAASIQNSLAAGVTLIPDVGVDFHWWGMGGHMTVFGGSKISALGKIGADVLQITSSFDRDQANIASRTAGYQRRADDWIFQARLAARELMENGRQILASLVAQQVAYHDYQTVITQVQQAQDVQSLLLEKFANSDFYRYFLQTTTACLYYQYYRFAFDTARRAEQAMKQELMRPELDATQYIQFNYWDTGHQGLLSGEALYLDIKRMELAYHDFNRRELELTRHVSLRQLDPMALLTLKITGTCTITLPEWLYDRDCPGHYMRRIKSVSLSVPSVVGPYTSINCTVSLQQSSVRVSPLLSNGVYGRDPTQDDNRFVDYLGSAEAIVTSGATNDSGMFETNLKDERFLPFEGAGAISTWTVSLPSKLRPFDYMTISDVILHIRYTARQAAGPLGAQATSELINNLATAGQSGQALMFCLRYDFPTEWAAFVNGGDDLSITLQKDYFPYMVQSAKHLNIDPPSPSLYHSNGGRVEPIPPPARTAFTLDNLSTGLSSAEGTAELSLKGYNIDPDPTAQIFLVLKYSFSM